MRQKNERYLQFEKYMTICLGISLFLFIVFLFASGFGTIWLKAITSIINILLSYAGVVAP